MTSSWDHDPADDLPADEGTTGPAHRFQAIRFPDGMPVLEGEPDDTTILFEVPGAGILISDAEARHVRRELTGALLGGPSPDGEDIARARAIADDLDAWANGTGNAPEEVWKAVDLLRGLADMAEDVPAMVARVAEENEALGTQLEVARKDAKSWSDHAMDFAGTANNERIELRREVEVLRARLGHAEEEAGRYCSNLASAMEELGDLRGRAGLLRGLVDEVLDEVSAIELPGWGPHGPGPTSWEARARALLTGAPLEEPVHRTAGALFRQLRADRSVTLGAVARAAGVKVSEVSEAERGRKSLHAFVKAKQELLRPLLGDGVDAVLAASCCPTCGRET